MSKMRTVYAIGEVMREVSDFDCNHSHEVFGGDTYNTCVYLARLGVSTEYVTAIGKDLSSNQFMEAAHAERVGTKHVLRHPSRTMGMYRIENDPNGERRFHYQRDQSAARHLFNIDGHEALLDVVARTNWLYLSGITLSLYDPSGLGAVFSIAKRVRENGGKVIFDPNFRPKGWKSRECAQKVILKFAQLSSIVLPTLEDERSLWGDMPADHSSSVQQQYANRWFQRGARLVILKCGARGAEIHEPGVPVRKISVSHPVSAVDTTGAGDSFNAGVLAGLISNRTLDESVRAANMIAGTVIQHRGAISPIRSTPRGLFSRS